MKSPSRSLLRYFGGKWTIAPWVISFFPKHRIYVEPFGGGASILLQKERSYAEVYNDLDGEIVNLFEVVRDNGKELERRLRFTPFSRAVLSKAYTILPEDNIDQALNTIVKSFQGFGGDSIFRRSGFRCDAKRQGTIPAHDWKNYPELLPAAIERLQGVVFECDDALKIMRTHDSPETLFYLDPPYHPDTRKHGVYREEYTHEDHYRLLKEIQGLRGMVVLSGYGHEMYDCILKGWRKEQKHTHAGHPGKDGSRKRIEQLYISPNVPPRQIELQYHKEAANL